MPAIPAKEPSTRVDAHHHLWDPARVAYSWLKPSLGPLNRAFYPAELAPLIQAAGIERTVLVQAMNSYEDTDFMLAAAAEHAWIAAVVGWVPLDRPREAELKLREYTQQRVFKGVRPLINLEEDPDWIVKPEVLDGLGLLMDADLSLDVVAEFPRHLQHVPLLAQKYPALRIVIDHLAKPPIKDNVWEPWAGQLAAAAHYPNVYAKISGLNTVAPPAWTSAELKPYIDFAMEIFGAHRLMFGSDWPVSTLAGTYAQVWEETNRALSGYTQTEIDEVMGLTAQRFYCL